MDAQHVKSFNVDQKGKNRFRFASSKQRSKKLSADVYRSYKRRFGVTSAGDREENVHRAKRRKEDEEETKEDEHEPFSSTFAEELELANDRNGSALFAEFYREIWPLVRSVPELLHHSSIVVELLLSYMLSPESMPGEKTPTYDSLGSSVFVPNLATTDVLHLLAVLAKDLQHEIHCFVYSKILPRIVTDLLNPPAPPADSSKQPIPVDVLIVETAFRTLSYIFQYDAESMVTESTKKEEEPCLERLRSFYGPTLGHRREIVRRLAAETYAPLIRRIKTDGAKKKHVRRIIRALTKVEPGVPSHALKRAKDDAIDGVATLLFVSAKGVSGRLHSKGLLIVRCVLDCFNVLDQDVKVYLTQLTSLFLRKVYSHIRQGSPSGIDDIVGEVRHFMVRMLERARKTSNDTSLVYSISVVLELLQFRNGTFFPVDGDGDVDLETARRLESFKSIVEDLTDVHRCISFMSVASATEALKLFFATWNVASRAVDHSSFFELRLSELIQASQNHKHLDSCAFSAQAIVETYLDICTDDVTARVAFPSIVSAIAGLSSVNADEAKTMLFRVVSRIHLEPNSNDDLFSMASESSGFSCDEQSCLTLLDLLLDEVVDATVVLSPAKLASLSFSTPCITFLCSIINSPNAEQRMIKWMLKSLDVLVKPLDNEIISYDRLVPASLLIQCFARVASLASERTETIWLKEALSRCKSITWDMVLGNPGSLWATKAMSSLCELLDTYKISACDDANDAFDVLVPNLNRESHFLRLYTLRILNSFPSRPYVTNHHDVVPVDDLDEEVSAGPVAERNLSGLTGICDLMDTLLKIETSPVGVDTERKIAGLLTRAEVIGKSGKLPIVYAEALANQMIGMFHIKFSSLWAPASRTLRGLSDAHPTILSTAISDALERLLDAEPTAEAPCKEGTSFSDVDAHSFQKLCIAWDASGGRDTSLFQAQIDNAGEDGRVSPFLSTDLDCVFQQVMKVLEAVPEITAKHSRRIVPMFLDFLKTQYYSFHDNDPDSRELQIEKWSLDRSPRNKELIRPKSLQGRLLSFLKAFAAVKGSEQLHKRSELLSVFIANLSHQDVDVAGTSLICLVNFKFSFVAEYSEKLQHLLRKGGLRNALLDFDLSRESEIIHPEHRKDILPIVLRILFGRISTSSTRGVKSKDSPEARRKAIVSCLSQLDDVELFPMFFFMIRNYIPLSFELQSDQINKTVYQDGVLRITTMSQNLHFNSIPIQRHEGFLNLLSVLVAQLGQNLDRYLPSLMTILLGIMKCSRISLSEDTDETVQEFEGQETDPGNSSPTQRIRSVKTLSFRCTAALMDKYADSMDITPYVEGLWEGISVAVTTLPDIVAKSNSSPSILSLLLVLSAHPCFRPILETHIAIVESVIRCIGPTSDDKALDVALDFVLNLTSTSSSLSEPGGHDLIESQVLLLLQQFRLRFGGALESSSAASASDAMKTTKTLSKELMVLRMVADLMLDGRFVDTASIGEDVQTDVFNTLSNLLVQFLGHPRTHEADRLNVLRIVSVLLPKVDAQTAVSHYFSLSKLVSHDHWSRLSPSTRREVTETMRTISRCHGINPALDRITHLLQEIFAVHHKRIDEMDYDRVIPALSGLHDPLLTCNWESLLRETSVDGHTLDIAESEPKFLTPVVYACLALMQQDDVVVSRSAFKALRHLITSFSTTHRVNDGLNETTWSKFIETSLMPGVRHALRSSNEQVRRHAISLVAEVSKAYAKSCSPNLHGDLSTLCCEENPDLDFFLNILHVQSHRRNRALQRLRTRLGEIECSGQGFSVNSLSNILLPLVTFPIYESKSSLEEGLVQESIATVGALGRHLSWNKYHAVLWTALNQFSRRPNQERLIIGMICALLDGFHFDLVDIQSTNQESTAVWRALEKRVIPKVENLMVNELRDRAGKSTRSIRPNVILALLKLFNKFPSDYFEKKLPRLLAIVCDALKNRDSNVRELARKALAAMVVEVGPKWLSEVIRSLAVTLTEGYQLHVRSATLHHIIFQLSKVHSPPQANALSVPDFDQCIPAMMDLIMQDMFGVASERRDIDGAQKKLVKEASGLKYLDSIEMICQLLLFKPSEISSSSSLHNVVKPFFEKLQEEAISTKSLQKVKDCLRRIVTGLARNESACVDDLLQFVHATIAPILKWSSEQDPLSSGDTNTLSAKRAVVVWHPGTATAPQNAKGAMDRKLADQANLITVKDGAQAPKLTGTARHSIKRHANQMHTVAGVCAVEFGLNLLLTTLKSKNFSNKDYESRLSPFLSLLTTCTCDSKENVITTLSIRCIALLLKKGVVPSPEVLNPLGAKIIDILSNGEAIVGANQEMTQTCLVALSTLLKLQVTNGQRGQSSTEMGIKNDVLSLSEDQMIVLISMLKESIMTSDDSNAALGTLKALLSLHFVSPELYDLMEGLLDASVRSHRESFRDQCSSVFAYFLVEYPLSERRFEQHLRQVMLNIKYEHKEGRMSAIRLIHSLIDRLPLDLIDKEVQLIFLPLVLQLVNDDVEECRESIAMSLKRLVSRLSVSVASAVYEYVLRWNKGDQGALRRASLQLFGIFVESRSDILDQNQSASLILGRLQSSLECSDGDWEQHYFALVSVKKVIQVNPSLSTTQKGLWAAVLLKLSHSHLWVRMMASRIVGEQLQKYDPIAISREDSAISFITERVGSLYELASVFCSHLDEEESNMSTELSELAIKTLAWLARAMHANPELCYASEEREGKQPVKWLLTRLSNIARRKGTQRRKAVFKCFAAISYDTGAAMISPFLDVMIEPMHRAIIEASGAKNHLGTEKFSAESDLAKEVLAMLEERCENEFLPAFAKVKVKAMERRDQRKDDLAAERIADPAAAARKKIDKQIAEKERRKRRVESHRSGRGATAKRQHL